MAEVIRAPKLSEQARALSSRRSPQRRRREPGDVDNPCKTQHPAGSTEQSGAHDPDRAPEPLDMAQSKSEPDTDAAPTDEVRSEAPANVMDARSVAAEHRLHEIQEELVRERRAAIEEGRAKGYREGMEASRKAVDEELQRLKSLIESLSGEMSNRLGDQEDAMVEVVCASIVKILGQLMLTPEGVVGVVRNVIAQLSQRDKLIVRVSPDDFDLLEVERQSLLEGLDNASVELVPDGRVKLGGCLLETDSGGLDGRLEVQLQRLNDVLLSTRAQRMAASGK